MLAFGLAIFWGAFLLFLVQPLIARFILPWFGGGPAVWTTCMLFFQILLLGGYAYAHFSISRLRPRRQVIVHIALLGLALLCLPITPGDEWKPVDGSHPVGHILLLLLSCLGLPYLVLAATGPLFQAWFSATHPGVSPYRLYALSNVGSLLALLGYPFLLEPNFSRQMQAYGWSIGLMAFAGLAAWCGSVVWRRAEDVDPVRAKPAASAAPIPWVVRALWLALPACGVILLLAITNKVCQDIAVIPFLWVMPLALYLLSFILSFDSPRWYRRWFWLPALGLALATTVWLMLGDHAGIAVDWPGPLAWLAQTAEGVGLFPELGLYLVTLFIGCMVCHGEVYRLRPEAGRLTGYYLSLSAGGAAGGLFVAALAPLLFTNYFELHVGLLLLAFLVLVVLARDPRLPLQRGGAPWGWGLALLCLPALSSVLYFDAQLTMRDSLVLSRNFYGVLKVSEAYSGDPSSQQLVLQHGVTTHGLQFMAPEKRRLPATYYTATSGVGRLLRTLKPEGGRHIAVVGLGTGSLAAWGQPGDRFRFYEINEDIRKLARGTFTFLSDSAAKSEVVMGDARLSLEREPAQGFDAIVLDAFSSDAIPVHLLTREAFETYRHHLRPGGVIAVHISNRCLNLQPVVLRLADHFRFSAAIIKDNEVESRYAEEESGAYSSDWVLLSTDANLLARPPIGSALSDPSPIPPKVTLWTDDQSDLLRILLVEPDSFLGWLQQL